MAQTEPITARLGPAHTGKTIQYQVYEIDASTVHVAWTGTDVSETSVPGTYRIANGVSAPDAGGYIEFRESPANTVLLDGSIAPAAPTAAQINTEVDTALSDYDAPTKAEMDAGFAALNDVSAADVNSEVDTALSNYDAPTHAELNTALSALILTSAERNAIADAVLSRSASNVDGTAEQNSLYELIQGALQNDRSVTVWTIYKTDGVTQFNTRTLGLAEAQDVVSVS